MNTKELKIYLSGGRCPEIAMIYKDTASACKRYISALDSFVEKYGERENVMLLSVPGRSEILGNHTDHNNGKVLAGAIDRDIIAVAAKNDSGAVRLLSEGYDEDVVDISDSSSPEKFENFTSRSLIAGMVHGIGSAGYEVGGFDAYTTSDVLKGSGISSSAAYEVMIGNIINHLYCGGAISNVEIAKIAQYSENVYFGKPSGLMDQMACAVGGFVYIDFKDPKEPIVAPLEFSLSDAGYELCIVNTGGNHADLNEDYASVPGEMKAVAAILGKPTLCGTAVSEILANAKQIRGAAGDRAFLRAMHFAKENERVERGFAALKNKNIEGFFKTVKESGASSFQYLQNVYTNKNVREQGISVALAVTDGALGDAIPAFRVHGGGFAGTIQAYVKRERADEYEALMNSVFGDGSVMRLSVRPYGAVKVL